MALFARSIQLGGAWWQCAMDPPTGEYVVETTVGSPPGGRGVTVGSVATPDQLAELFAGAWPHATGKPPPIGPRLAELVTEAHRSYPALEIDDRELIAAIRPTNRLR